MQLASQDIHSQLVIIKQITCNTIWAHKHSRHVYQLVHGLFPKFSGIAAIVGVKI